jgi:hypothetical protein
VGGTGIRINVIFAVLTAKQFVPADIKTCSRLHTPPDRTWGPPRLFSGGKAPGRGFDQTSRSSVKVENE